MIKLKIKDNGIHYIIEHERCADLNDGQANSKSEENANADSPSANGCLVCSWQGAVSLVFCFLLPRSYHSSDRCLEVKKPRTYHPTSDYLLRLGVLVRYVLRK